MYPFVIVLSLLLCGVVHCQEPQCSRFEYDERVLNKLLTVEANCGKLQTSVESLEEMLKIQKAETEEKLQHISAEYLKQCKEMIMMSTSNVLRIRPVEYDGWKLIFRGTAANGLNLVDAWTKGTTVTTTKPSSMKRSNDKHYSDLNFMNDWTEKNIVDVKVALYHNEMEVASLVFDAVGSSRDSWFAQERLKYSSWPTLTRSSTLRVFSLKASSIRLFMIMTVGGGCEKDMGFMIAATSSYCDWEKVHSSFPLFMYSQLNEPTFFDKRMYGMADFLAIFVRNE